jgi:hypothetical protein
LIPTPILCHKHVLTHQSYQRFVCSTDKKWQKTERKVKKQEKNPKVKTHRFLCFFTTGSPGKLNIPRHDSNPHGRDCTKIIILKQSNKACFSCLGKAKTAWLWNRNQPWNSVKVTGMGVFWWAAQYSSGTCEFWVCIRWASSPLLLLGLPCAQPRINKICL